MLLAVVLVIAVLVLKHVGSSKAPAVAGGPTTTATSTAAGRGASTTTSTTIAALPPGQVKVLVLNGTLAGNLAGTAARRLAASPGFSTLAPDNTTSKVLTSNVYAASAQYVPSAQAIAALYGLPASAVVDPIPTTAPILASERALANVVLVIGPDIAGKVAAG